MKELKIMKTTKRYNICHWSVLIGLLLLGAMQMMAVDYKSTYRGVQKQPVYGITPTATAPSATFQSTSSYSGQWTTNQYSMLNSDGSVNGEAYMTSGPNRAKAGGPGGGATGPGTPTDPLDPTTQQPLGDGLWILLFLICAYTIYNKVLRSGKNTKQ